MDNKVNFTGGFLLKKPSSKMWEKIYNEAVPKNRIIIHDLYEEGNLFFATKTVYDSSVLRYLLNKKNINFTYYPEINLKNRLNSYFPEEAIKTLEAKQAIDSRREMRKFIKPEITRNDLKYRWKPEDQVSQTLKALKLPEDSKVVIKNNITTIYDSNDKVIAKASPNTTLGINYACIYPRYSDEKFKMAAINHKGEIISITSDIDKLQEFKKEFLKAVKIDAFGRKRVK